MDSNDVKQTAIVVAVTQFLSIAIYLILDWILKDTGQATISQNVWREPALAVPVLFPAVTFVGALAVHLLYR